MNRRDAMKSLAAIAGAAGLTIQPVTAIESEKRRVSFSENNQPIHVRFTHSETTHFLSACLCGFQVFGRTPKTIANAKAKIARHRLTCQAVVRL